MFNLLAYSINDSCRTGTRYTDTLARKMDMLNADLQMKNDVADSKKRKRKAQDEDEDEAAFHFIAFLPVDGMIWKLDGLERQPYKVGMVSIRRLLNLSSKFSHL